MIALQITSSKDFMGKLLISESFHDFLMIEAQIITANVYTIDGHIQKEFYSKEEWEDKTICPYLLVRWQDMKSVIFSIIKGKHTPVKFQIVLQLKPEKLLEWFGMDDKGEIGALLCTVRYENGKTLLLSGVSYNGFTMNKEPERMWDSRIKTFLVEKQIDFEDEI